MKKFLLLWTASGILSCTGAYAEGKVFVAAEAAAAGDGSAGKPYQTLAHARDGIRSQRQAGTLKNSEAVTVEVGPGVYPLSKTSIATRFPASYLSARGNG